MLKNAEVYTILDDLDLTGNIFEIKLFLAMDTTIFFVSAKEDGEAIDKMIEYNFINLPGNVMSQNEAFALNHTNDLSEYVCGGMGEKTRFLYFKWEDMEINHIYNENY